MALTPLEIHMWTLLRDAGQVPEDPAVLQFGEVNLYSAPNTEEACRIIRKYAKPDDAERLVSEILAAAVKRDDFAAARIFYDALLHQKSVTVIDQSGSDESMHQDLNGPLNLPYAEFDILINSGTGEHVFNQAQFWESAHDHTKPGGLMYHSMPLWGWLGHGFYNYHPTIVPDLAAANNYEITHWSWVEFDSGLFTVVSSIDEFQKLADRFGTRHSTMMQVVFRKSHDDQYFKIPSQGYYDGRLTEEQIKAWAKHR